MFFHHKWAGNCGQIVCFSRILTGQQGHYMVSSTNAVFDQTFSHICNNTREQKEAFNVGKVILPRCLSFLLERALESEFWSADGQSYCENCCCGFFRFISRDNRNELYTKPRDYVIYRRYRVGGAWLNVLSGSWVGQEQLSEHSNNVAELKRKTNFRFQWL